MTNSAWIDATGSGSADFNGGVGINPLIVVISLASVTNPKVRVMGDFPRRLLYAGLIGFTTLDAQPDDSIADGVGPWHRLEWELEEWQVGTEIVTAFASSKLFWRLPINIEFKLQVFW